MNKWYTGQKVYDKSYGVGVIDDIISKDNFPIKVEFIGNYETYTIEGKVFNSHDDISLFPMKKGTPEARRIVAMLASDYRKCKKPQYDLFASGIYSIEKSVYLNLYMKAKAMLGE